MQYEKEHVIMTYMRLSDSVIVLHNYTFYTASFIRLLDSALYTVQLLRFVSRKYMNINLGLPVGNGMGTIWWGCGWGQWWREWGGDRDSDGGEWVETVIKIMEMECGCGQLCAVSFSSVHATRSIDAYYRATYQRTKWWPKGGSEGCVPMSSWATDGLQVWKRCVRCTKENKTCR